MTGLRVFVGLLGLALLAATVWAVGETNSLQDFRYETLALLDQPWAALTLTQLSAGLLLVAVLMVLTERSFIAGALWALPLIPLGHIWTAFWLVLRLPRLADRLSRPDWPSE